MPPETQQSAPAAPAAPNQPAAPPPVRKDPFEITPEIAQSWNQPSSNPVSLERTGRILGITPPAQDRQPVPGSNAIPIPSQGQGRQQVPWSTPIDTSQLPKLPSSGIGPTTVNLTPDGKIAPQIPPQQRQIPVQQQQQQAQPLVVPGLQTTFPPGTIEYYQDALKQGKMIQGKDDTGRPVLILRTPEAMTEALKKNWTW